MFDIPLPEDFFAPGRDLGPAAVAPEINTEEFAKSLKEEFNWEVRATIPRWPKNTVCQFDIVSPLLYSTTALRLMNNWRSKMFDTYVLVRKGVDMKALKAKLDKIEIPEHEYPVSIMLTPLKDMRHKDPTGNQLAEIKFSHVQIFSIAGLLVIVCSLFNHLILFVTRARMRFRELALRKVHGASDWQIAATLYTDFLLVIVLSLVICFMVMVRLLPAFKEFTEIESANVRIYKELAVYAVLLIVFGFIADGIPVLYFRKQILNDNIKGAGSPGSRNLFHKSSLLLQLMISYGMIVCAAVFIKQIRYLHHADSLGFDRSNVACVYRTVNARAYPDIESYMNAVTGCALPSLYADQIKQIPGIVDAFPTRSWRSSFVTFNSDRYTQVYEKDGQPASYGIYLLSTDYHFFDFFGVEIVEGMKFDNVYNDEGDWRKQKLVVNETAIKEIGKELLSSHFDIVGVARDFSAGPTTKPHPIVIYLQNPNVGSQVVYRYEKGMREQTEQAVTQWLHKEFHEQGECIINFAYAEDVFEENFKSERMLLIILSVMTFSCMLIAVFGVYSFNSLTCKQRRKEIAIRKINGAEVMDIMNIFFKEYLILLAIAALVAFPAGYIIMKQWLEGYVKQTSMDAWIFVVIFLFVFATIVISIFSTVWKAANQNPAEVVKSE